MTAAKVLAELQSLRTGIKALGGETEQRPPWPKDPAQLNAPKSHIVSSQSSAYDLNRHCPKQSILFLHLDRGHCRSSSCNLASVSRSAG